MTVNHPRNKRARQCLETGVCVLLVLPASGCGSKGLSAQDLTGNYALVKPNGTETLNLRADGTFDEVWRPSNGTGVLTNAGKWRWSTNEPGSLILDHAMFTSDLADRPLDSPRYGTWELRTRVIAGAVELVVDADSDVYFQKKKLAAK
jgi:hypothetical protein